MNLKLLKNKVIGKETINETDFYKYLSKKVNDKKALEKLMDINTFNVAGLNYYGSKNNPPYYKVIPGGITELLLRESVCEKLRKINIFLSKYDLELFVFDAWRPISVQNYFFNFWVPNYLSSKYPKKGKGWIKKETAEYWAKGNEDPVMLVEQHPPHSTGGAVDLTIRFKSTKQFLEMGTIFDDNTVKSHVRYFENIKDKSKFNFTEEEALKNRRLIYNVMTKFGFASHPKEWWHYSYGDKMWANTLHKKYAIYGYIEK